METLLRFDRGTLVLEGFAKLPDELSPFFRYDARIDAFRASAHRYSYILPLLKPYLSDNRVPRYNRVKLKPALSFDLYPHQTEALEAWKAANGRGVIALPTGSGKSLLGVLALAWAGRSGLVVVPTIDLMHQWYALLRAAYPDIETGLIGGGYYEVRDLSVATYDSAALYIERFGNRYAAVVFDEVHHLPSNFYRTAAEYAIAPYRLGLTATPERTDSRHQDLDELVGPIVYRKETGDLAGDVLAPFRISRIYVELSDAEREAYEKAIAVRDQFLKEKNLSLSGLQGWHNFVMISARSPEGRRAMRSHRESKRLAQASPAKLRALEAALGEHQREKTVIFTDDNETVYEISKRFLIPSITHQTKVKERQEILEAFRRGDYRAVATSRVLNEGIDVPDASVAVILSGSSVNREFVQRLGRILRRAEGKKAILYEIVARRTSDEYAANRRRKSLAFDSLQPTLFPMSEDRD